MKQISLREVGNMNSSILVNQRDLIVHNEIVP